MVGWGGPVGTEAKSLEPSSFSALTLLVVSFDLQKLVPDMIYNVFGGTLTTSSAENGPVTRAVYKVSQCVDIKQLFLICS